MPLSSLPSAQIATMTMASLDTFGTRSMTKVRMLQGNFCRVSQMLTGGGTAAVIFISSTSWRSCKDAVVTWHTLLAATLGSGSQRRAAQQCSRAWQHAPCAAS